MAADIDPRYDGAELWASGSNLHTVEGDLITENRPRPINFGIWWDGDLLRELLDHDLDKDTDDHGVGRIDKWNWETEETETIFVPEGTRSNNWTKGNPSLQADLFGDWREEVIWPSADSTELRIYTTTDMTEHRIYTLMHDPTYRLSVAWQNVAYNQPPHTGFFLGHNMDPAPTPAIYTGDEIQEPEVSYDQLIALTEEFIRENGGNKGNINAFVSKLKNAKRSEERGNINARNGQLGA